VRNLSPVHTDSFIAESGLVLVIPTDGRAVQQACYATYLRLVTDK